VSSKTTQERDNLLDKVYKLLPKSIFRLVKPITDKEEQQKVWQEIKEKKHPIKKVEYIKIGRTHSNVFIMPV